MCRGVSTDSVFQLALITLLRVFYNLYLHPLSRFQGPKSFASSDLLLSLHQLLGTCHGAIKQAHDSYGSVVRIAPNELSFISAPAWNDIYARYEGRPPMPKDTLFFNDMLLDEKALSVAKDHDHGRIRRALAPAFSQKSILEQEPILAKHVDLLLKKLDQEAHNSRSVDLRDWYNFTTFDIIGDLAFGEDFGCLTSSSYHIWVRFVLDFFYATTLLHVCHKFYPLNRLLTLMLPTSVMNKRQRHNRMSLEKVRQRMEAGSDRSDYIFHLMKGSKSEQLTVPEIEAQASVIILAGSETASVGLTAATYHLLKNTHTLDRLTQEIRHAFASEDAINILAVNQLPYLSAILQETLRLNPPIVNGFPRQVPKPGATISGHWVPGGVSTFRIKTLQEVCLRQHQTVVCVSHWAAYRSATHFLEPDLFAPERWLNDKPFEADQREILQPFSVGPRNCIGKRSVSNIS